MPARRLALAVCILALTVHSAASARQQIPAQPASAPPGPRTGLIVGQVVDANGAPIPEAIVQMSLPKYSGDLPTTPKGRVMADDAGRFFFSDLPAGDYSLRATKEGYVGGAYGQRRADGNAQRFTLAENERRSDAKLILWQYGVIAGTVVDEAGEPIIGVTVQALQRGVIAGGGASWGSLDHALNAIQTTTTDDRGIFRLSALPPSRYVVVVPFTLPTVPVSLLSVQDDAIRNEMYGATAETAPVGNPKTVQVGEFAMLTGSRAIIPPSPSASGRMTVYRTTYFPAAATASGATQITIASGEERADLRIALRPVPAIRITGKLVTPDGSAPPPMSLRLVGETTTNVGEDGFETATSLSDASGRFMMLAVPPGQYVLKNASRLTMTALQGRPGWWAAQPVTVGGTDIGDLVVTVRPALRVTSRVEFKGTANPATPVPPILMNGGISLETPMGEPGSFVLQSNRGDGTFTTLGTPGKFIIRPWESGGWFVKSVVIDGKDVTDRVIDLQADTTFAVEYTDAPSKVSGTVRDARGAVSPLAAVLVFPADRQGWTGYGFTPRSFKTGAASQSGAYALMGLPAGDYLIAAIDDADVSGWTDPKTLEVLARQATKLTLAGGESKTIDLTLKAIR